jgi:hypothetical protein
MLAMNGGGNNRGRETRQGSDLDDAPRRKNTDQGGEKEVIAGTNPSRIPDIIQVHHGMKKIELARRWNFSGAPQDGGQGPVFDLEFLEGAEFANIEAIVGGTWRRSRRSTVHLAHELEPAAARRIPKGVEIAREGKDHVRIIGRSLKPGKPNEQCTRGGETS